MKMKLLLAAFILILIGGNAFADYVSIEKARIVAKNVYFERINQSDDFAFENVVFDNEYAVEEAAHTLFYVFNMQNDQGFVMIAADDQSYPILGYTFKGRLVENKEVNPAFANLIESFERQLINIIEKDLPTNADITNTWNTYLNEEFQMQTMQTVGPLIQTSWNQSPYYNALCPGGSVTGCVATAMAQVIRYYQHPNKGTGSHSYYHSTYGNLSANFGTTTYNYANMPLSISSANNDVATLCYHCGVSVEMNYSPSGSSASTAYSPTAYKTYFGYSTTAAYDSKDYYTDIQWKIMLRAEHMYNRPVMYRGTGSYGGHSFIVDGFQYPDHFHFNWGWGGSSDGYFYLTSLNPGYYDFTSGQGGVFNLYPDPNYSAATAIEETEENGMMIYPNPSDGNLNLAFDQYINEDATIYLYDISGRMIKVLSISINGFNSSVEFQNLDAGQYQLIIKGENLNIVEPLIIK